MHELFLLYITSYVWMLKMPLSVSRGSITSLINDTNSVYKFINHFGLALHIILECIFFGVLYRESGTQSNSEWGDVYEMIQCSSLVVLKQTV